MYKILILTISIAVITGSGAASTVEVNPADQSSQLKGVTISAGNHTVEVSQKIIAQLQEKIEKGLYEENDFIKSDALLLEYKFLQQEAGNQLAKLLIGSLVKLDDASLTVLVTYTDANGNQLAQKHIHRVFESGFFGISVSKAIGNIAEDIVDFTVENFKN